MKQWLVAVLVFGGMSCAVESDPSPADDPPAVERQAEERGVQPAFFRCLVPQTCACPLNPPQLTGPAQTNGVQCGVNLICC